MFKGKKNNLTLSQPAASISNQLKNMDLAFPQKKKVENRFHTCAPTNMHFLATLKLRAYFPHICQIAGVFSTHWFFLTYFAFPQILSCGIWSVEFFRCVDFFFYPHDRPICGKQNSTQQFHRSGNVEMLNSSMRRYQRRYIAQEFSQATQVQNLGTEINTIQQLAGTCIRELRWALVWLSRLNNSDQ